jgi:hypothetical protein
LRPLVQTKGIRQAAKLLASLHDTSTRNDLLTAIEPEPLLSIRLRKLVEVANDGGEAKLWLQAHHDRLSWHIQRLYRLRNEIVHGGDLTIDLPLVCSHLAQYLHDVLYEVSYRLATGDWRSLAQLALAEQDGYDVLMDELGRSECLTPDLALRPPLPHLAW